MQLIKIQTDMILTEKNMTLKIVISKNPPQQTNQSFPFDITDLDSSSDPSLDWNKTFGPPTDFLSNQMLIHVRPPRPTRSQKLNLQIELNETNNHGILQTLLIPRVKQEEVMVEMEVFELEQADYHHCRHYHYYVAMVSQWREPQTRWWPEEV